MWTSGAAEERWKQMEAWMSQQSARGLALESMLEDLLDFAQGRVPPGASPAEQPGAHLRAPAEAATPSGRTSQVNSRAPIGARKNGAISPNSALNRAEPCQTPRRRTSAAKLVFGRVEHAPARKETEDSRGDPIAEEGSEMSRTQVTNGEAAPKTLTKSTSDIAKSGAEILAQGKAASPFKQPLPERTRREVRKEQAVKSHWKPISKGTQARLKENQSLLERVVSGRTFEILSCILVVANAVTIGIDTQVVAWERQVSPQTWVEPSFTFLFTVELILRMMSLKRTFFESAWNGFDFLVVVVMLTEQVLNTVHDLQADFLSQMSMLRILRIVRIIRVFRVIRMLKFFRELRMMIQSILASFVSLLWAMLVLGLLFYIFGIALCQGAVEHLMSDEVNPDELMAMKLDEKFGSLDKSWLSLYEAMAGGISWGELVDVLTPMNKVYTLVFLLFITFAIFGVVNIVTGVFVDTALQNSKSDRETLIQDELHEKQRVIKEIKDMFQEMDTSGDGIVGIEEFQVAVEDDRMVAYFNALELDISDIHGLFVLLDRDHQGAIDIEEFVTGCMRLRGEARTIDLAKMMLESEYTMHNVEVMVDALQVLFDALGVQEAVRTRSSPFEITGADESGAAQASRDPLALPYSSSKSFDKQPLD